MSESLSREEYLGLLIMNDEIVMGSINLNYFSLKQAEVRVNMLRRVFAWILLIGFIFTFVDIVFIGFARPLFATVYIIAVIAFFLMRPGNSKNS